jgi:hypothetical protein
MARESKRISCGLKVHFTSRVVVCLFVQYVRGQFPVIRLAHVARLAQTQKSLSPHSGEMRPRRLHHNSTCPYPKGVLQHSPGSPRTRGAPWENSPPRCRIYPERVIRGTVVEPLQGTSHKNEPTQGAPGVPATLGYIVKPQRGRNPRETYFPDTRYIQNKSPPNGRRPRRPSYEFRGMAHESKRISCGLKVHFTSRVDVCLFVPYARDRFPVIRLAHVARLAQTQKSLSPHSGEMRPPEIAPQLDLPLPRRGSTTQPRVDTYAWRTLGKLPPRCRIYPERVICRTIVEPLQGTAHKNEQTQGAPGVPETLGYIVKPLRGRNTR